MMETAAAREEALKRLEDLAIAFQRNGIIDFLEQLSELTPELLSYLTDPRILRIASNLSFIFHILELLDPTIITVMTNNFTNALSGNLKPEVFAKPPQMSIKDLLRQLRDPDIQRAFGFIFLLLKSFGQSIEQSGKQLTQLLETMQEQLNMLKAQRREMGLPV